MTYILTAKFIGYAKQQAQKYGLKGFRVAALRDSLEWISQFDDKATLSECDPMSFNCENLNEFIDIVECKGPNAILVPHLSVCGKKYPYHASIKYVKAQLQRNFDEYGKRALMAEKNEGVDWKALSHAVRVNSQVKELLSTNFITFPRPDRELLLNIKTGQINYKDVAQIIEDGLEEIKLLEQTSSIRKEPDQEYINNLIFDVYSNIVKS